VTRRLKIPGLAPPPAPRLRAKRDWTSAEFKRALERNGLRPAYGGTYFLHTSGLCFPGVFQHDPIRIARRATVAQIRRALCQESENAGTQESES